MPPIPNAHAGALCSMRLKKPGLRNVRREVRGMCGMRREKQPMTFTEKRAQ